MKECILCGDCIFRNNCWVRISHESAEASVRGSYNGGCADAISFETVVRLREERTVPYSK